MSSENLNFKINQYHTYHGRGKGTLQINPILYRKNRDRLVQAMRKLNALQNLKHPVILLKGGESTQRYCSDHEPIFRQESYFHWMFGVREPDFYGAINIETGKSYLFAPNLPQEYSIWLGELRTLNDFKVHYEVDYTFWFDDIKKVLKELNPDVILTLYGLNSDSGKYSEPAFFDGINEFKINKDLLYNEISELRVFKTEYELEVLRYVNKISSDAHKEVMKRIKPGMKEYQLEALFKFYCAYYGGARFMAYTCICGSGRNSAILHYGHSAEPNNKELNSNDMCLLDMGAEYFGYAADITCSYPCSGKFTKEQAIIYNAVLKANLEVQKALKPEVSWVNMHLLAERIILEQLTAAGLLTGNINEMIENRLGAIFMPHGLGHFIGIDTHDVGGYLKGNPPRIDKPGLKNLRTARIIKEGMCITIEPGCYFINALLEKAYQDVKLSRYLVKSEIEKFIYIGGIRIEDDVYVNKNGIELLSKVPRQLNEIEEFIEEARNNKHTFLLS